MVAVITAAMAFGPTTAHAATAHAHTAPTRSSAVAPAKQAVPGGDEVVTGSGDINGYHVYAAASGDGYAWHSLATLLPAGAGDESWIGQQCLTGDGQTVVAVVAPFSAANSEGGMDHGGYVYAIDAHTGTAHPLATGASLAYFDPGCGTGSTVALTSYLATDEQVSRITVLDARARRVVSSTTVRGELTSAVPVGRLTLAARGNELVTVSAGQARAVGMLPGQITEIRAAGQGAYMLGIQAGVAGVWHWTRKSIHQVGSGQADMVDLFMTGTGHVVVAGASQIDAHSGLTVAPDAPEEAVAATSSITVLAGSGKATRGAIGGGTAARPAVRLVTADRQSLSQTLPASKGTTTTLTPSLSLDATLAPASGASTTSITPLPAQSATPVCAVPRNDIYKQVPQPTPDRVRWAINQAIQGALTSPYTTVKRPTSNGMYTIDDTSYTPLPTEYANTDFPLVSGAPAVPPLVMYGILAAESNWNQASWHAAPGRAGNPLVANYYGTTQNYPIDYSSSDCGYGIAQITDPMKLQSGQTLPTAVQMRIAVDYATNIAASIQILQTKWMQLHQLGVKLNNDDATKIENWYGAIWAYNSGVHNDPSTYEGLGWYNNPANPTWKYNRHTFLHVGYSETLSDASTPQYWPYQERVFGWMEVPLMSNGNILDYRGTYDWDTGKGGFLSTPPVITFCSSANHCDPGVIGASGTDPCPDEDGRCYWDWPVTWAKCPSACVTDTVTSAPNGHTYYTTPGMAEPSMTLAAVPCTVGYGPGADAVVVDDETLDPYKNPNPSGNTPNLMGCASPDPGLIPPSSVNASFNLVDQNGNEITHTPSSIAAIDTHQLGGGLGGHLFFTHTSSAAQAAWATDGVWQATLPADTTYGTAYEIKVFVPDIAAATGHASYQITVDGAAGDHNTMRRTISQANYSNQWVSLGYYLCGGYSNATCGMTVKLHTVTPDTDTTQGADVAFDAVAFVPVPTGQYVALGDSYSSGEGLGGGWQDGTDVAQNVPDDVSDHGNLCHRSDQAWPQLLGNTKGLPVINLACSGSDLADLTGTDQEYYLNQTTQPMSLFGITLPGLYVTKYQSDTAVTPNIAPGVLEPNSPPVSDSNDNWFSDYPDNNESAGTRYFDEFDYQINLVRALRPRVVTLTMGGNDVGFADILNTCLSYDVPELNSQCYDDLGGSAYPDGVYNRIQSLEPMLAAAYTELASAVGANRVNVVTYPKMIYYDPNAAPGSWDCTDLYDEDRQWLVPEIDGLDDAIVQAAGSAGVHAVDIRDAFSGHEACQSTSYVTEPDFNPLDLPGLTESQMDNWFHPNSAGYTAMANAIGSKIVIPLP